MVIKGETTVAEIIPIGLQEPKTFKETGIVKVCAAVEEDKESAKALGKSFE